MRLILVEDDKDAIDLIEQALVSLGYAPKSYTCPVKALTEASRLPFEAALLDVNMPNLSGLELRELLKRINPEMKIYLMSGCMFNEDHVLAKPFNLDELKSWLERAA